VGLTGGGGTKDNIFCLLKKEVSVARSPRKLKYLSRKEKKTVQADWQMKKQKFKMIFSRIEKRSHPLSGRVHQMLRKESKSFAWMIMA